MLPPLPQLYCAVKSGFGRRSVSLYSSVFRLFIPIVIAGAINFEKEKEKEKDLYTDRL